MITCPTITPSSVATQITNCGETLTDGNLTVEVLVGDNVVAPARLDLWIRHPNLNGGQHLDVSSSVAVTSGQTLTISSTVAIPEDGSTFEACLRLQPDGTGNFPIETQIFCCDFVSADPVVTNQFLADEMRIDERWLDQNDFGVGSMPDKYPMVTLPADAVSYGAPVTTTAQFLAAVASNPADNTYITIADGASIGGNATMTIVGNGGSGYAPENRIYVVPQTIGAANHFGTVHVVVEAKNITFEGLTIGRLGVSGEGFDSKAEGVRLNNCHIKAMSNTIGFSPKNDHTNNNAKNGDYFEITNCKFDSIEGGFPFYPDALAPSDKAANPTAEQVKGFTIDCNDFNGPFGTNILALLTSSGWSPVQGKTYLSFSRNRIFQWEQSEEKLLSIKTSDYLVSDNLILDIGKGFCDTRIGGDNRILGNVILGISSTRVPYYIRSPNNEMHFNISRGKRDIGAIIVNGAGIVIANYDPVSGTFNPTNEEVDYYPTKNCNVTTNISEGDAYWLTATDSFGTEPLPSQEEANNNIFEDNFHTNPTFDPPRFNDTVDGWLTEAVWNANNTSRITDSVSVTANNVSTAHGTEIYQFPERIVDMSTKTFSWDPDPRNPHGSTINYKPGPAWKMVKFYRQGVLVWDGEVEANV